MSTFKCPACGLVNFAAATECKRCHSKFSEPEPSRDASRLKCPECGLINFASATECKRCQAKFGVLEPEADKPSQSAADFSAVLNQLAAELKAEGPALLEVTAANEPAGSLTPLPEYFDSEPAPFTVAMVLFAVTLGLGILLLGFQVYEYSSFYGGEEWKVLTNPTHRHYFSYLEPLFFSQWIVKVSALFASLLFIFLFLRKSYAFLRWFRAYLIAHFIFLLADGLAVWLMETTLRERDFGKAFEPFVDHLHWYLFLYGIGILLTPIWFLYFKSGRVRKTFIN